MDTENGGRRNDDWNNLDIGWLHAEGMARWGALNVWADAVQKNLPESEQIALKINLPVHYEDSLNSRAFEDDPKAIKDIINRTDPKAIAAINALVDEVHARLPDIRNRRDHAAARAYYEKAMKIMTNGAWEPSEQRGIKKL